jgi:hypothetical protein
MAPLFEKITFPTGFVVSSRPTRQFGHKSGFLGLTPAIDIDIPKTVFDPGGQICPMISEDYHERIGQYNITRVNLG